MTESRPVLAPGMSGRELVRWYWLRSELADFARSVGVPPGGGKQELTARLVAFLGDDPPPEVRRRPKSPPLMVEPLTAATLIPVGQRCTEQLRHYFTAVVGPAFRFDATMRDFIAGNAGRTLGAAVDHWYASRSHSRPEIGAQFELNRFLRSWRRDHPHGSHVEALQAWATYRALPVEGRATGR